MAKFKAILGDIRGKIGGNVFSANRFGAYIRQKVTPVNPNTEYQQLARLRLAESAATYATQLTESQRELWKSWAYQIKRNDVFGNPIAFSGFMAFAMVNGNKKLVYPTGFTYELDPPPIAEVPIPLEEISVDADVSDGKVELIFTPTPTSAEVVQLIYCAGPYRPNTTYPSNFKFVASVGTSTPSPYDFYNSFIERFGALVADMRYYIRVKPLNVIDWLAGETKQTEFLVVA
jgi:hypothetical protein